MSLPRYAEYRDSGVEWLGKLPREWRAMKTRLSLVEPPCYGVLVPDFQVDGVPMIRITDIQKGVVSKGDLVTISDELSAQYNRTITKAGDVLLSVVGTIGEVVVVDESIAGANLSRSIARLQVSPNINRFYLAWVLRSDIFTRYVDLVCVGSAQRVLNMADLSAFAIPVPSPEQQYAIATFLDREAGKIDALITEQEKLLALLAEKRQATISHAVTRGLNPNAPMKDSGVPWLGEVPAHWTITRLKFVAAVQTGIAKGKDTQGKEVITVPYLRVANVQDGHLALDEVAMIDIEPEQLDRYRLQAGDVLMNEGGDFDKLGRGAIWNAEIEDCIHQNHVFAVRPHAASPQWLNQITGSQYAQFYFMGRSKQSTNLASISSTNIMELPVLLPPVDEQASILAFVDNESARLDALYASSVQAIALLKERRSALIAAAVTGKIDVRCTSQTIEEACA